MSCSYVCTSCRRRWLLGLAARASDRSNRHANRASLSSFSKRRSNLQGVSNKRLPTARSPENTSPQRLSKSAENDFLERIFKGVDPQLQLGLYSRHHRESRAGALHPPSEDRPLRGKSSNSSSKISDQSWALKSTNTGSSGCDTHNEVAHNIVKGDPDEGKRQFPLLHRVLLDEEMPIPEALETFDALTREYQEFRYSQDARHIFSNLLNKATQRWCQDPNSPDLPLPSTLLETKAKFFNKRFKLFRNWNSVVWTIVNSSVELFSAENIEAKKNRGSAFLDELVRLWDMQLYEHGSCTVVENGKAKRLQGVKSWEILTQSKEMRTMKQGSTYDLKSRLSSFFRKSEHGNSDLNIDLPFLATYIVLRHYHTHIAKNTSRASTYFPLLKFLAHLIQLSDLQNNWKHYSMKLLSPLSPHKAFVTSELTEIIENDNVKTIRRSPAGPLSLDLPSESDIVETFLSHLGRAVSTKNAQFLERLWGEVESDFVSNKDPGHSKSTIPRKLYTHFLDAFMKLDMPSRAIDIWNTMIRQGMKPTVAEWDVMLKGCSRAKDPHALEDLWAAMIGLGIKPDARAWTNRIHGLVRSGNWQMSVRVFDEMMQNWTAAALQCDEYKKTGDLTSIGDIGDVPKPNIYALNSLIQGLTFGRKFDEVATVLRQAAKIGVKADIYTYNSIMRTALMEGNADLAVGVMLQMREDKIQPDIVTFTLTLRSVFSDLAQPPEGVKNMAEAQQAAIKNIFREMKDSGIKADMFTFSTVIMGILAQGSNHPGRMPPSQTLAAAHSVLEYMRANDIAVPINIYTSLIGFYFSSALDNNSNPDLAAIDSLCIEARGSLGKKGLYAGGSNSRKDWANPDAFFYDRLIEGFGRAGEIGRMMTVLAQAGRNHKPPSWVAMISVLQALLAAEDLDRAKEVVASVRAEEARAGQGDLLRAKRGKKSFWDLVEAAGLGTADSPVPEDGSVQSLGQNREGNKDGDYSTSAAVLPAAS